MWNTKARVISIVIGVLRAEYSHTEYLALIGVMNRRGYCIQQIAVLKSAYILRTVLFTPAWRY